MVTLTKIIEEVISQLGDAHDIYMLRELAITPSISHCKVSKLAQTILLERMHDEFNIVYIHRPIVVASVGQLGFPSGGYYKNILRAARNRGFGAGRAETVLALLSMSNIKVLGQVLIGMWYESEHRHCSYVLRIQNLDSQWPLVVVSGSTDRFWRANNKFAFSATEE